jgi:hypothetical protein
LTSLRPEVLAARLEAMAWGEPELGNPRRPELGLAKAMAGTGKGIWTFKDELLPRVALNGSQDVDPTGSELVLSLIRALRASDEPVATVRHWNARHWNGAGPC